MLPILLLQEKKIFFIILFQKCNNKLEIMTENQEEFEQNYNATKLDLANCQNSMFQYSVMVIFPWFLLALNVCGCILQNLFKKYISQGRHQMSPQVSSGRYTIDFDESDHRSRGVVSSGVGSISWNEGVQDCAQTSYQEQL